MAGQPHPDRVSVRLQLWREMRDRVQARASENGESMTALISRAIERELTRGQ